MLVLTGDIGGEMIECSLKNNDQIIIGVSASWMPNSRTISQSWPTLRSYHENITLILFLYLCFKVGMREEWKVAFPTHRLKGCSFHFNQVFINDDGITCGLHHLESSNRFHRLCSGKCRTRARHNCTVRNLCLELEVNFLTNSR